MRRRRVLVCCSVVVLALTITPAAMAQLPDTTKTPGSADRVKPERLCAAEFAAAARPVSDWQRTVALERYGIRPELFHGDLDHLVPVALGGTNDPDNLWPFHPGGTFTLDAKTALAAKLKEMVCGGSLTLKDAQSAFRKDWTKAYQRYMSSGANAGGGR